MADESEGAPAEEQVEMDIEDGEVAAMEEEGGDNTMMIVGGVIVVIVVCLLVAGLGTMFLCPSVIFGSAKDCVKTDEFSDSELGKCQSDATVKDQQAVKDAKTPADFCTAIKGSNCGTPKEAQGKPCCKEVDPVPA